MIGWCSRFKFHFLKRLRIELCVASMNRTKTQSSAMALEKDSRPEESSTDLPYQLVHPTVPQQRQRAPAPAPVPPEPRRNYDDIDARGTYRSNSNVDWSRASFKVKKPKPGKVRHLSRDEIFGIGMSFLLSITISALIALCMYYLTPIVLTNLTNFLEDMRFLGSGAASVMKSSRGSSHTEPTIKQPREIHGRWKELSIADAVSLEAVSAEITKQQPVLFATTADSVDTNLYKARPISTIHSSIEGRGTVLPLTWQQLSSISPDDELQRGTCARVLVNDCSEENESCSAFSAHSSEITQLVSSRVVSERIEIDVLTSTTPWSSTCFEVSPGMLINLVGGTAQEWILTPTKHVPKQGLRFHRRLDELLVAGALSHHAETVHVLQQESQALYIPPGWFFASRITPPTDPAAQTSTDLSITHRHLVTAQQSSSSLYSLWTEGRGKLKSGDIVGALKVFKLAVAMERSTLSLLGLADALAANEQYLAAEEVYRELLQMNPQDATVYSRLINMLINYATKDASDSITELLQAAKEQGVKEDVLQLSRDSL